ncbi:hypothetical protein ABRY77_15035 [Enterococcus casseliflavus]|uniref:hypothetical protein n=1 Tax=Enterococcus casseliflavus TaxID=37734 RepID=UPI003EDFCE4D
MATTRKRLTEFGFEEVKKTQNYRLLQLVISETGDRFRTVLHWYSDTPKKVYINMYKTSGTITIIEDDVLGNHNKLYSGVLKNWNRFKEIFPEIKSAI